MQGEPKFRGEGLHVGCKKWTIRAQRVCVDRDVLPLPCKLFASAADVHFKQHLRDVVGYGGKYFFHIPLLNFAFDTGPNPRKQAASKSECPVLLLQARQAGNSSPFGRCLPSNTEIGGICSIVVATFSPAQ